MASTFVTRVRFNSSTTAAQWVMSARLLCRPLTNWSSSIIPPADRHPHPCSCCVGHHRYYGTNVSRTVKRYERLGIGPDGSPLPTPNTKKIHPKMYKVLLVNQDGSTYTIRHRYPHKIIKLPLDLSTLTPEQLAEREKIKAASTARVYVEEEGLEEDDWDQERYRNLT